MTKSIRLSRLLALSHVLFIAAMATAAEPAASQWVQPGPDGKLIYKTTETGDKIMDFSHAGYMGGGIALPNVPVKQTVEPTGTEDDSAVIQAAIDAVSAMPLENGFRGAVLLKPGVYNLPTTLRIQTSGVVLRGSGSLGETKTTIKMVGGRHSAITIGGGRGGRRSGGNQRPSNDGEAAKEEFQSAQTTIADAYVPAGATTFAVADAAGLAVGDTIAIRRPTTEAWVKFMEMDTLTRNGRPQTWIGRSRNGSTERKISAINGNKLTLEIPLADSYDSKYLGPQGTTVSKVRPSSPITQVGVENLHIQCPPLEIAYGRAPYSAIRLSGDDCWVRDVFCEETMNSTVLRGKRITMERVIVKHTYPNLGASKPTDFSIEGSQILLDRCEITGDNMYFVWTGSLYPGPNVLLNCTFSGRGSRVQPHMRWSTGLLVDNCTVDGGIDFMNRGVMGSGHGWTMGWAVAWNCVASTYVIQNPPGAINWAIGCIGERVQTARPFDAEPILPEGIFDSHGTAVAPQSLYLAQLSERLGPDALENIGYSPDARSAIAQYLSEPSQAPKPIANAKSSVSQLLNLPEQASQPSAIRIAGTDLALNRPVNAGNMRGDSREFSGEKAVDGNDNTYWATNDSPTRATLEVDLEGPVKLNAITLGEAIGLEQRVEEYKIEGQMESDWKLLSQGTTIGEQKVDRFPDATVWKVRLTILKAREYPAIRKFGFYRETEFAAAAPAVASDSANEKANWHPPQATAAGQAKSEWVQPGPDGKLIYKTTETGDKIMDFSHAGYMGGGVALPNVPVKQTVEPTGTEDDSAVIQAAIDAVSALPLENGFRGAVLLKPGAYNLPTTLRIQTSGVVLRGSGSGANEGPKTTLKLTGRPHGAIAVRGPGGGRGRRGQDQQPAESAPQQPPDGFQAAETTLADNYLASGAISFTVADAKSFAAGDWIEIQRPVTKGWVEFMGMHDMVRNGRPQTWIRPGNRITNNRQIAAIDGNKITLAVPLSDSFDPKFAEDGKIAVTKIRAPALISQVGVEHLHIESPPQEIPHSRPHFTAFRLSAQDAWARDVVIDETMNSVGIGGRRITLERVTINRKALHIGSSRPAEFAPNGSQLLLDRCTVNANNIWFVATGGGVSGPIVLLNCNFLGKSRAESHQRWSTGMLYDNCRVPEGAIELRNRGSMGSGHGWSMGWGVVWNCEAEHYIIQQPPGSANWLIGSSGENRLAPRPFGSEPNLPAGFIDAPGTPVAPKSLYLSQLAERLGPQALKNIGY